MGAHHRRLTLGADAFPCTGLHTDQRFMRARLFIDHGGALALAANCNPGTSPSHSMPRAIALAVRF